MVVSAVHQHKSVIIIYIYTYIHIYVCVCVCVPFFLSLPSLSLFQGNGNPLQYSCLENPMDRGAWWAAVHGVAKTGTRLSDFTLTFHFPALEKEMATHSSVLAWRIPGMGEPRRLTSMGSHRVGHDRNDLAAGHHRMPGWAPCVIQQLPASYVFYT